MDQPKLFYENELDALRDDVAACGGSKEVGHWFWPDKSVEAARNEVNARLNVERRERFTDDQKRLVMRRARERRGFSATVFYICDDTGFERPKPLNPVDELALLQRAFVDSVADQRRVLERMERLTRAPLAGIDGGKVA